jgi:aryl-alcohol dehydrogenase-like predicted oxidoreductase
MQMRPLGRSGLSIPPIIFGGNVFGWTVDQAASFKLLDGMVAGGLNAIDSADVYSAWVPGHTGGESERVIGAWLKQRGRRDDVVIMTKCGIEMPGKGKGLGAAYIAKACDDSLQRLGIDTIDFYWAHRDDEVTPPEETLGAFDKLIKAGKVKAIGASNFSAPRLKASLDCSEQHGLPRYEALQPHYNLMERAIETDLVPLCVEHRVAITPYYALAAGFLTGKYRTEADLSKSPRGSRTVTKYMTPKGMAVLDALQAVAEAKHITMGQAALAWMMAKPGITAPIASATTPAQLAELVTAAGVTLDGASVAALDAASV